MLRFDFAPMDARACSCQGPASFPPRAQDPGGLGRGEWFSNQDEEHLTVYILSLKSGQLNTKIRKRKIGKIIIVESMISKSN